MKTPQWLLDKARHCLHSIVNCSHPKLDVSYDCARNRRPCTVLKEEACAKYEKFPECQNR